MPRFLEVVHYIMYLVYVTHTKRHEGLKFIGGEECIGTTYHFPYICFIFVRCDFAVSQTFEGFCSQPYPSLYPYPADFDLGENTYVHDKTS